ncbi:N-acetylmuramoyl-L-alanine amidase [Paenibacillus sp.]
MLSPEDANKIIRFLSAAYYCTESKEARREFNRLANELRKASGQPIQ